MRQSGIYPQESGLTVVTARGTIDLFKKDNGEIIVSSYIKGMEPPVSILLSPTEAKVIEGWFKSNHG